MALIATAGEATRGSILSEEAKNKLIFGYSRFVDPNNIVNKTRTEPNWQKQSFGTDGE